MAEPTPIEHGTLNGARKEAHRGLPICDACRVPMRAYQTERARARRRAAAEERAERGLPTYYTEEQWQQIVAARKAGPR